MNRRRRRWRLLGLACVAFAALLTGAGALGALSPRTVCAGRFAAGIHSQYLELAIASHDLDRQGQAWGLGGGGSVIILAPGSAWRPSASSAWMSIGGAAGPGVLMTIKVVYIPLWPWVLLLAAGGGAIWWLSRRAQARGQCPHCDYDLRGLTDGRCPECGRPTASPTARLRTAIAGLLARRYAGRARLPDTLEA